MKESSNSETLKKALCVFASVLPDHRWTYARILSAIVQFPQIGNIFNI